MKTQSSRQKRGSPRAAKLKTQKCRKGFTLIEMLVVVVVFGIGIVGAFSFFNMNLISQFEVKNELIAAHLAQEGVDLVRNIRDYNLFYSDGGVKWYNNLHNNSSSSLCPSIDFSSLSSHACQSSANVYLCLDTNKKYYQCADSTNTGFKRTITVTKQNDLDSVGGFLEIECKVEWNGRTTTAKDILYNNIL